MDDAVKPKSVAVASIEAFDGASLDPVADPQLVGQAVEGLHPVPGHPLLRSLGLVAATAGRDHIAGSVLATFTLRADVVDGQALFINRRAIAVRAAVVPGCTNTGPPLPTSL